MKLCTIFGVGFDDKQTFVTLPHWGFHGGRFFVDYPHDGPRFIKDLRIFQPQGFAINPVYTDCGFYNPKRHGLFTDRNPQENGDKVTVALLVNGFTSFHNYKFINQKVIRFFKRLENSNTSLTILVLSSKNKTVRFEVRNFKVGGARTFEVQLVNKRGKNEVRVIEVSDRDNKPRFWKPLLSLIAGPFRFRRPRADDDRFFEP